MKEKKILILSTKDRIGGAAIAAYRLFTAIKSTESLSVDMLVTIKTVLSNDIYELNIYQLFKQKLFNWLEKKFFKVINKTNQQSSLNLFGALKANTLNKQNYDVINIHWINNSFISLNQLSKLDSRIFITLHDSWFICGYEHHPVDKFDINYISGFINDKKFSLNRFIWKKKKKLLDELENVEILVPSKWLMKNVINSKLANNIRIHHLPNPLNTNIFKPLEKSYVRKKYYFDDNDTILMVGAYGNAFQNNYKGFDLLHQILEKLKHKNLKIICVGHKRDNIKIENIEIQFYKIEEEYQMAELYNCSNATIIPSRIENLTQLGTESLACGIPVISFDVGGNSDIVTNDVTGYIIKPFDTTEFANKIMHLINLEEMDYIYLSKNCRKKAIREWDSEIIAKKFKDII